jgi:hypothetical protein
MTIEDLVRDAQRRQADRAAPAERILSGLPARIARARRRRRIGLAAGGGLVAVAVAAAIAVPSLVIKRAQPAVTPPPSVVDVPLNYRLTWVPEGFRASKRSYVADAGALAGSTLIQRWEKPTEKVREHPSLELQIWPAVPDKTKLMGTSGARVDVGGVPGLYTPSPNGTLSQVSWSPRDRVVLKVTATDVNVGRDVMLRMVRSVVPDPGLFRMPIRPRAIPDGWSLASTELKALYFGAWSATVGLEKPSAAGDPGPAGFRNSLLIGVDRRRMFAPDPAAEQLTVAGRPARFAAGSGVPPAGPLYLEVDLGTGMFVHLQSIAVGVGLDQMIRVAENVDVTGVGVEWLGTR